MEGIGDFCWKYDCFLLFDIVIFLGGVLFYIDEWKVDFVYSCSQKGLSCFFGFGFFIMGFCVEVKMIVCQGKVFNWYLDVLLLNQYWGSDCVYYYIVLVNMNFGMCEVLCFLVEEGFDQVWVCYCSNVEMFWNGLEGFGFLMYVLVEC